MPLTPSLRHFVTASLLLLSACEKSPPPPASAQPANQGGLSNLSETPQSLLGKSAAAGRDAARSLEAAQAQAAGMADEISGQTKLLPVAGLEFRPPTNWTPAPGENKMRAATLTVAPGVSCVFLTGIGGSVEDNVNRWKAAVTESGSSVPAPSKVQSRNLPGGLKVTTVYAEGTYSSMASGAPTPQPDSGFRGAIVEGGPQGLVFVRLTGPAADVEAATPGFEQLVFGARKP